MNANRVATDTDTVKPDFTVDNIAKWNVGKQMSITSDSSGIKLSGDAATPGNNKYYGTDGTGTKGFQSSTGTGNVVLATSPTLVTPALGTPSAAVLTSATGLPLTTGVTGTLPVANGGTGTASTLTGLVRGNASAMTAAEISGDGTTSGSNALTLATVNGNVGSFTNANITVNAKGLVTAAANGSAGSVTGSGATNQMAYWSSSSALTSSSALNALPSSHCFLGLGAGSTTGGNNFALGIVESQTATVLAVDIHNTATATQSFSSYYARANNNNSIGLMLVDGLGTSALGTAGMLFGMFNNQPIGFITNNVERWRLLIGGQWQNKTAANETTGGGTALLGTNSPAVTNSAPFTWQKVTTSDGSQGYIPIWK